MATHGETFTVDLPTVTITGSTKPRVDFVIDNTALWEDDGTGDLTKVDGLAKAGNGSGRVVKPKIDPPTITGVATVTITAAAGTQVHYTFNGRNPSFKGISAQNGANGVNKNARLATYGRSLAQVYSAPFTIVNQRPGQNLCVLRLRAHKVVGGKVSPNEKSKVMILKFYIHP